MYKHSAVGWTNILPLNDVLIDHISESECADSAAQTIEAVGGIPHSSIVDVLYSHIVIDMA